MPDRFYLLSLKWSPGLGGNALTWWRPNRAGYTAFLESAGVYTSEECAAIVKSREDRRYILPVPCELADSMASRIVDAAKAAEMKWKAARAEGAIERELCEWNPKLGSAAVYGDDGACTNHAVVGLGSRRGKSWHLCAKCAALPNFSRFRVRTLLNGGSEQ